MARPDPDPGGVKLNPISFYSCTPESFFVLTEMSPFYRNMVRRWYLL